MIKLDIGNSILGRAGCGHLWPRSPSHHLPKSMLLLQSTESHCLSIVRDEYLMTCLHFHYFIKSLRPIGSSSNDEIITEILPLSWLGSLTYSSPTTILKVIKFIILFGCSMRYCFNALLLMTFKWNRHR